MQASYTAQELAMLLGVTKRAVLKRAGKEQWPFVESCNANGGGRAKRFPLATLSESIQLKIRMEEAKAATTEAHLPVPTNGSSQERRMIVVGGKEVQAPSWDGLTQKQIDGALVRSVLVERYREHYGKARGRRRKIKEKQQFVEAYNLADLGWFPALFKEIGPVSFQTLERWDLMLKREHNDPFALADLRGRHLKGRCLVTAEQGEMLVRCALNPNGPLISEVIRRARERMAEEGIICGVSDDTLRRWLMRWKREHQDKWIAVREGAKAVNDKLIPHIRRDYDAISVGDIVFCDGHTCNLGARWTPGGKEVRLTLVTWFDMKSSMPLGWEISLTENTQSIATALYRAILFLGRIPGIAYLDNGKAFRSKYFNGQDIRKTPVAGTFQLLGMEKMFAWAYHGETKTVERWHKTLGEFEREVTSYTGTSIETKPPRMLRGEKLHRKLHELATEGRVPSVLDLHEMLADWIDRYSKRPSRGHLRGRTPYEVFDAGRGPGLTEAEKTRLKMLLSQAAVRSITRDGIKMPWGEERYYHPDLYGRAGQSCVVRYDELDRDRVWVYDLENRYICEAERMRLVHPAARLLGDESDQAELERQLHLRGSLMKRTFGSARELVQAVVVPEVQRRLEAQASEPAVRQGERLRVVRIEDTPKPVSPEDEAAIWAEVERSIAEQRAERDAEERRRAEAEELRRSFEASIRSSGDTEQDPDPYAAQEEAESFERAKRFLWMEFHKEHLPPGEQSWFVEYQRTEAGMARAEEIEQFRIALILGESTAMPGV